MNIDSARTVQFHAEIIKKNIFLRKVYESFYKRIQKSLHLNEEHGTGNKKIYKKKVIIELGSGGGFIKQMIPNALTSDVVKGTGIDTVFSAEKMPFKNESVDAFVMLNVFHHIKRAEKALFEMQRCLKKGGKIVMIEPWNTPLSRFVYQNFHHEQFNEHGTWNPTIGSGQAPTRAWGRLSSANGAIPWILFKRDRQLFEKKYNKLKIVSVSPHTPFLYILSGGLSHPPLVPKSLFPFCKWLESFFTPLYSLTALFVTIKIKKVQK